MAWRERAGAVRRARCLARPDARQPAADAAQGLLHQQADLTTEALHRAGWQDGDVARQEALDRALAAVRTDTDVIVGPWTGEVGFELLYWIPFLSWLADQGPGGRRMVVVSRGGAALWYRHLTSRYVDILDLVTPRSFANADRREEEAVRRSPRVRPGSAGQGPRAARARRGTGGPSVRDVSFVRRALAQARDGRSGRVVLRRFADSTLRLRRRAGRASGGLRRREVLLQQGVSGHAGEPNVCRPRRCARSAGRCRSRC